MFAKPILFFLASQFFVALSCYRPDVASSNQHPDVTATSIQADPTPESTRTDCENPENGRKKEKLNGRVKLLREEEIEYAYGAHKIELKRLITFRPDGRYIKDDE